MNGEIDETVIARRDAARGAVWKPQQRALAQVLPPLRCANAEYPVTGEDEQENVQIRLGMETDVFARRQANDIGVELSPLLSQFPQRAGLVRRIVDQ